MKQLAITLFICLAALGVNAQSKPEKPAKDTIVITDTTVKAIKIGQKVLPIDVLKQDGVYVTLRDLQGLIALLQEYPAKCANPITEAVMRYFGLAPKP